MNYTDLSFGNTNIDLGVSPFQELKASEEFVPLRKIWDLKNEDGWVYHYHWQGRVPNIKPIGQYKLRNLIVTRPGGMIISNSLGYNCDTAIHAVKNIPVEENLFELSPKNKIIIDEDVLVADGVSCEVYGHWIVDYLPRFGIARDLLQEKFYSLKILLVSYTPDWVLDLLCLTCNVNRDNIILYNPETDIVLCENAILPSYSYTTTFFFHRYFKEFYQSLRPILHKENKTRKILVSRALCPQSNRKFPLRDFFEQEASKRGYEIIHPEQLSISDQIKFFSEAKVVIGEHGSGMHNAVFCDKGTIVGCLGFWNAVQIHIGFVMEHHNVYLTKGCKWPTAQSNEYNIECSEADLISFFGKIQLILLDNLYDA